MIEGADLWIRIRNIDLHKIYKEKYLKLEVMFCMVSASRSPRAESFSLSSSMDLDRSIR
jgi:hypothetical protein